MSLGLSGGIDYATTELISGSGTGLPTATGPITSVQRGFIQSVSGSNTFRGNIELNANGVPVREYSYNLFNDGRPLSTTLEPN